MIRKSVRAAFRPLLVHRDAPTRVAVVRIPCLLAFGAEDGREHLAPTTQLMTAMRKKRPSRDGLATGPIERARFLRAHSGERPDLLYENHARSPSPDCAKGKVLPTNR